VTFRTRLQLRYLWSRPYAAGRVLVMSKPIYNDLAPLVRRGRRSVPALEATALSAAVPTLPPRRTLKRTNSRSAS